MHDYEMIVRQNFDVKVDLFGINLNISLIRETIFDELVTN